MGATCDKDTTIHRPTQFHAADAITFSLLSFLQAKAAEAAAKLARIQASSLPNAGTDWTNLDNAEKWRRIRATRTIPISMPTEGKVVGLLAAYKAREPGYRQRIIQWAMNGQVSRTNANPFIGDIETSRSSIRSIVSHGTGPLKVLAIPHLDTLLREAIPYNKGVDGDKTFINMAHRLSFEEKAYIAYISVREDRNGNRTYDVEFGDEKRLSRELPGGTGATGATAPWPTAAPR